jgi:phosphatidylserine/phosphatidylglycerophosphate/cardiolipin synthase-like enzyme
MVPASIGIIGQYIFYLKAQLRYYKLKQILFFKLKHMKRILLLIPVSLLFLNLSGQAMDISEARGKKIGTVVTITGIITNSGELGIIRYIQDHTAGIGIYSYDFSLQAHMGDSVSVTGTLKNYNNLLELDPVTSWTVHSSGHDLPEPILVTIPELNDNNEGMLVKIENVLFENGCNIITGGTYYFSSAGHRCQIYIRSNDSPLVGEIIPSQTVTLIGINSQFFENYQVLVRSYNDLFSKSEIYLTSCLIMNNLSQSGFDLHWTTNINGSTELFYGNTPDLELGVLSGTGNTAEHEISITGRDPSELLYVQAISVAGEDTARSSVGLFITQSASSGEMKVYFNRSVDTTVSTGTKAVQLHEALDDTLISYINRAKYSIDFTIYNYNTTGISDITAALNAAHTRGVEIRIVSDFNVEDNAGWKNLNPAIVRIISPEDDYEAGIGIMHNKFVVFDALSSDPMDPLVWTGSTNFTEGQINNDPNNVIIIQDQSLAKAYRIEFEEMFGSTGLQPDPLKARFGKDKSDNTPHEFIISGSRVESYFSPSDRTNAKIEETIKTAEYSLYINTMLITRDFLANAIVARKNADVNTKVVVNSKEGCIVENNTYIVDKLMELGENFRDYNGGGILHHKALIVDPFHPGADPLVLTGSHNWSSSADLRNDENSLIIHNADIANIYYQEFVERFKEGEIIGQVPIANNDFVQMDQGDTLIFDVFENDTIPGPVALTIISYPNHGTVNGNNNGIVTYIPDPEFANALDTIIYKVCSQANPAFCDSAKMVTWVMPAIGISDLPVNDFSIYPNPAEEIITLLNPTDPVECTLTICNLNGQIIWSERKLLESGPNFIHIDNTPQGLYILEIRTDVNMERFKFIIN